MFARQYEINVVRQSFLKQSGDGSHVIIYINVPDILIYYITNNPKRNTNITDFKGFIVIFYHVHGLSMGLSIYPEPVMATYIKS